MTASAGYAAFTEETSIFIRKDGNSSYSVWLDMSDGGVYITGLESEDEVPEILFGDDLTVECDLTIKDNNGSASTTIHVTVNVDVEQDAAEPVTLTYTVVEPADWDGKLYRRASDGATSVTIKVDGDYTADDLEWAANTVGTSCIGSVVENEDGSAIISHVSTICGGGGGTVTVSLTDDPSVSLEIDIACGE